jgi:hypothetical protein
MNNTGKSRTMSYDEILADPSLAHMHEMVRYVHNTPASQLFPKKHEMGLKYVAQKNTRKLYSENPDMPIKKVLMTVFEQLTDDIPAPLMLKLTQTIIDMWEKLSLPVQQDMAVAIAA